MSKKTDQAMPQGAKQEKKHDGHEGCCSGNPSCTTHAAHHHSIGSTAHAAPTNSAQKNTKTRIVIKYDVGFNNSLYLRGNGHSLSWEKGIPLKNSKTDEWVWESDQPFSSLEFKVLINDKQYEAGDNHKVLCGGTIQYTPRF
jgi:hypothetical protein